jgi:hypothetical protein
LGKKAYKFRLRQKRRESATNMKTKSQPENQSFSFYKEIINDILTFEQN